MNIIPEDLNAENFVIYAIKNYDKVQCTISELEHDIKRIKYVKRLFRKYKSSGIIRERLILNHIIILNNVFGAEPIIRMLFYKIEPQDYDVLKTFLLSLNLMPPIIRKINGKNILSSDISVDMKVADLLRKILNASNT